MLHYAFIINVIACIRSEHFISRYLSWFASVVSLNVRFDVDESLKQERVKTKSPQLSAGKECGPNSRQMKRIGYNGNSSGGMPNK